jgi:hypothetical protein
MPYGPRIPAFRAFDFVSDSRFADLDDNYKVADAMQFIAENVNNARYCNIDLLVSKAGKGYAVLNDYQPDKPDSLKDEEMLHGLMVAVLATSNQAITTTVPFPSKKPLLTVAT